MKIPFLNIYVTRADWHKKYLERNAWSLKLELDKAMPENELQKQSETFTDAQGKLRFKHNGQFAPDNRTNMKRMHDQLRAECAAKQCVDCSYEEIKKIAGFGV